MPTLGEKAHYSGLQSTVHMADGVHLQIQRISLIRDHTSCNKTKSSMSTVSFLLMVDVLLNYYLNHFTYALTFEATCVHQCCNQVPSIDDSLNQHNSYCLWMQMSLVC